MNFSWDQEFKILNCGPFPVILGLDYLTLACMSIESGAREYYFEFALESRAKFESDKMPLFEGRRTDEGYFQLLTKVGWIKTLSSVFPNDNPLECLLNDYSALFLGGIGTARCQSCQTDLSDGIPVRSPLYRYAPPKMKIL